MSAGPVLLSLIAAALKAGLLLVLAGGLVAALRRASGRARHAVWAGALVGALLVPVLAPWVPDWTIGALRVPLLSTSRSGFDPGLDPGPAPAAAPSRPVPYLPAPGGAELGILTANDTAVLPSEAGAVSKAPGWWSRAAAVPPAGWLLAIWLLGCVTSLALFLRALRVARRLERRAIAADRSWRRQLADAQRRVGVRREVRLLHSTETATPMTWGWLRPVILLPARSQGWSEERRRVVLLHELVHVRRADWLVRLVARLACSLYWLNPLVWAAARRLAVEQEIACDEEVIALGTRPSSYARHLLAIARTLEPATPTPAHALDMARRSQMEGRLMSILDGSRRLRGGRGLTILALLLIAGLVPALAAIEPWVEEQESPGLSQGDEPAQGDEPRRSISSVETEGLARVLGELEALQKEMEPFEAELESLEVEMEPIERELEGIEVEMGPVEVELEGFESELEPFEEMLEAVEVEMEPYQEQLESIEAELEPFERRLEAIEVEMGPFEESLEAIEVEMEPFEEMLEAIEVEMEPLERELERLGEQMEPLARNGGQGSEEIERIADLMRQVHERMAPLHERMSATHEEMEPVFERMSEAHREMDPVHERMGEIHEEMEPVFERMAAVHEEMAPLHERMASVHEQMEPVLERMGSVHERMSPIHERMGEHHGRMEPFHQKMGEVHQRMRPLHEEMGQRHQELEHELAGVIERMLASELAGVTSAGTNYAPAAARIADAVSLRVNDGTLRIMSSAPELREVLDEAMSGRVTSSGQEFSAAADRFVRALGNLEVEAR